MNKFMESPSKNKNDFLRNKNSFIIFILGLLLVLLTGIVDNLTGKYIHLTIFYLIPILIYAWYLGRNIAIAISVMCFITELSLNNNYTFLSIHIWNNLVRFSFYIIIAIMFSKIKYNFENMKYLIHKLNKSLEKEKEINELKSRIVNTISHEFRTPLTIILNSSQMLKNYSNKISEETKNDSFNTIEAEIQLLTEMLDRTLLINSEDSFKLKSNIHPVNLENFCNELIQKSIINPSEKNKIIFRCENLKIINTDSNLIHHIISNLLNNAIKYSFEDTIVYLVIKFEENQLILSVINNGIGIYPSDIDKIFDPFFRSENVKEISGSGLGLSIVKEAVDALDGRIEVESKINFETTFKVIIPYKD